MAKSAPAKKTAATSVKGSAKKASENSAAAKLPAKKAAAKAPAKAVGRPAKKAATKKERDAETKYTDPALREHIKDDVMAGDKGGRPGQWSARKAQMVAHEYEAEGGGYKGGKDDTQKSLTQWGDEHWKTSDGKPAEQKDGMHRYLPEAAWDKMSPEEKKATDKKKLAGDHEGKQFVANTSAAVKAKKAIKK